MPRSIGRYYFVKEDRAWDPYIVAGLGYEQNSGIGVIDDLFTIDFSDSGFVGRLGAGVQTNRMQAR